MEPLLTARTTNVAGAQPTWSGDAVSSYRVVAWRFAGSTFFLAATDVFV